MVSHCDSDLCFLVTNDVEHLFMCFFGHLYIFEEMPIKSFAHLSFYCCKSFLFFKSILDSRLLLDLSSQVKSSVSHSVVSDSLQPRGPPGSSVHGILQAKNSGVGCHSLFQGGLPDPGIELVSPALEADSLPSE